MGQENIRRLLVSLASSLIVLVLVPGSDCSTRLADFYEPGRDSCPFMSNARFKCNSTFKFASFDGSCNNLARPWTGMIGSPYKRYFASRYYDNSSMPRMFSSAQYGESGLLLPNARHISRTLSDDHSKFSSSHTHILAIFGQFIAHDITSLALTTDADGNFVDCPCTSSNPACFSVKVPSTENIIKMTCMKFTRSNSVNEFFKCNFTHREQFDLVPSFLDASQVYAASPNESSNLRSGLRGLLKTSPGFMTIGRPYMPLGPPTQGNQFAGGEARANENMALASIHTLFLWIHNSIADELADLNAHWNDERVFLEARRIVQALYQHVVYQEYLPLIIGPDLADKMGLFPLEDGYYQGYDEQVNASLSNEFAASAFRFGHTLVRNKLGRYNGSGVNMMTQVDLLSTIFNTNEAYVNGGLGYILMGLLNEPAGSYDTNVADALQNHLFEVTLSDGTIQAIDLLATNVQRGRDHGLPSYVYVKEKCGSKRIRDFFDLTETIPTEVVQKLFHLYEDVDDIDFYIGGLAERSLPGAVLGPTFACIVARQFLDLKQGDRFYYENSPVQSAGAFTLPQLNEIRRMSLSNLICNNYEVESLQMNAFLLPDRDNNWKVDCLRMRPLNLNLWKET